MSREELEKKLADLEEQEFQLKMKDTWSNGDSQHMSSIIAEIGKIKRELDEIQ